MLEGRQEIGYAPVKTDADEGYIAKVEALID